jgi:DNA helicase II / ATP-dependent DNA helicase PcrA
MKSLNKQFNEEQLAAITYGEGPLLIVAGAGTGKTTVITERIKHLIHEGITTPSQILALTFTEKASREMEERVDIALPYGATQMWISTFHAFCDRILKSEIFFHFTFVIFVRWEILINLSMG